MRGWEEILDAVMSTHGRALYGYAFALTGRIGSADLLLEDALVRTLRGRRVGSVDVAARLVVREMRRALAHDRRRPPLDQRISPALDEIARAPEHSFSNPASAVRWNVRAAREYVATHPVREEADMLDEMLNDVSALAASDRVCLVMRYLDGWTAEAIAEEVGLHPETVRARLRGAADELSDTLAGLGLDPDEAAGGGHGFVQIGGDER